MLTNFFLRIYTSSYAYVICCAGAGILGLVCLERWLGRAWWRRPMTGAALAAWAWVVLYATVLSRDTVAEAGLSLLPLHSYRAVLNGANPEILRSSFMNVVLFFRQGRCGAACCPKNGRVCRVCCRRCSCSPASARASNICSMPGCWVRRRWTTFSTTPSAPEPDTAVCCGPGGASRIGICSSNETSPRQIGGGSRLPKKLISSRECRGDH